MAVGIALLSMSSLSLASDMVQAALVQFVQVGNMGSGGVLLVGGHCIGSVSIVLYMLLPFSWADL